MKSKLKDKRNSVVEGYKPQDFSFLTAVRISTTAIDRALQDEVDELQTGKKSKFKTKVYTFFVYGKTDMELQ